MLPGEMNRESEKPVVVIVGRPNVGKSTLFNRLVQKRLAIVHEVPGVTRDVFSAECEWNGTLFEIVDTGGIGKESEDPLREVVAERAWKALLQAHIIIFLVDATSGIQDNDLKLRNAILRLKKEVILAVNKVDSYKKEIESAEFFSLGIERTVFISALKGRNIGELLDLVQASIDWSKFPQAVIASRKKKSVEPKPAVPAHQEEEAEIRVALVGKRNVGKSSLLNALAGQERALVSELPGTTRDTVTQEVRFGKIKLTLTDTAGLLRESRMGDVDFYAYLRAKDALRNSSVCVLVLDATTGVQEIDKKVAKNIEEKSKGVVIALNKWDLFEDTHATRELMKTHVRAELAKLRFSEIVFVSAKEKRGLDELIKEVQRAQESFSKKVDDSSLAQVIAEEMAINPPPVVKNKSLKVYSVRQVGTRPPRFLFSINSKMFLRKAYRNFLENAIRRHFGFNGTHIALAFSERKAKKTRR